MRDDFKRLSLLILAITATACSRVMFAVFQDPEGPNLLVVAGMAVLIYLVSLAVFISRLAPALAGFKRCLAVFGFQIFLTMGFYLGLR